MMSLSLTANENSQFPIRLSWTTLNGHEVWMEIDESSALSLAAGLIKMVNDRWVEDARN